MIYKKLYTFKDLISAKIVFARNHVATQAALDALPYCIYPAIQLAVNGVNVNVTTRRGDLRLVRCAHKINISRWNSMVLIGQ